MLNVDHPWLAIVTIASPDVKTLVDDEAVIPKE